MHRPVRDLHLHSNCSDGLFDPAALVEYAVRSRVEELSLTDHDTLAGLDEAQNKAVSLSARFMPGIELTCLFGDLVVHLLGYGFHLPAAQEDKSLVAYLARIKERDHAWARETCRLSCQDPLIVRTPSGEEHRVCVHENELSWVRGTMPSPFHIAVMLARKLATISDELDIPARHYQYIFFGRTDPQHKEESFWPELRERYAGILARYGLQPGTHWWVPQPTGDLFSLPDAIAALERIGGLPVIAHPGEQRLAAEHIRVMANMGIRGVEVYTFKHSAAFVAELEALAQDLGLFATSGTDFHDPHHRAEVDLGKDRQGQPLTKGVSLADLHRMGAYVAEPS
jgi:predicted metal-dependent phosphoesterase TrpH